VPGYQEIEQTLIDIITGYCRDKGMTARSAAHLCVVIGHRWLIALDEEESEIRRRGFPGDRMPEP